MSPLSLQSSISEDTCDYTLMLKSAKGNSHSLVLKESLPFTLRHVFIYTTKVGLLVMQMVNLMFLIMILGSLDILLTLIK